MIGLLKRLFGNQKNTGIKVDADTLPLPKDATGALSGDTPAAVQPRRLFVGSAQSVGKQRDHNEDALFTLTATLTNDDTNLPFGLFIVADGMGGHRYGEVASGLAVRSMSSFIIGRLYSHVFGLETDPPSSSIQEILKEGVQEAHRTILQEAKGGGTTLTAVLLRGEQLTFAHVGDSRAYTISPDGEMEILTRDHSLVERLVELGQLTEEEAAVHPNRNVLYRALGQGEPFEADVSTVAIPKGGWILVCSDGLWGVVSEKQILRILEEAPTPQEACQRMVQAANDAGGPDNITAILVRLSD